MEYRLGELYEVSNGLSKSGDCFGSGYPFLSFSTVFNNYFIPDEIRNSVQSTDKEQSIFSIKEGDVFVTRTSETADELGMSCVALKDYPNATYNGFCKRLRPVTNNTYPIYMGYYFRTPQFRANFIKIASLITRASLRNEDLLKFKVELPTVEKQKQIAEILYTYDKLIKNNNERIKLLEQMAENLYKEWFVRFRFPGYETAEFENGLPKGWEIQQAQNIFDISIGRTPDRKQFDYFTYNENDVLWVSISDMKDNMFITRSSEYLTDEAIKKVNMPMVKADTVLLSFKLSVGRVAITTKLSCTNEAIAHFKTNDKDLLEYTYLYLKLFNYQNLGNTSAIGNAVNSTIIKKMKFILPNRDLLEMFHNSAKDIFTEIKNLKYSNENLIKQRDLLLPRLMSGKLEV